MMRFILSHAQGHKRAHKKQDFSKRIQFNKKKIMLCLKILFPAPKKLLLLSREFLILSLPFIAYNLHLSSSLPPCQSCDGFNWFQVTGLSKAGVQHQHSLTLYCPWIKEHMNIGEEKARNVCTCTRQSVPTYPLDARISNHKNQKDRSSPP